MMSFALGTWLQDVGAIRVDADRSCHPRVGDPQLDAPNRSGTNLPVGRDQQLSPPQRDRGETIHHERILSFF